MKKPLLVLAGAAAVAAAAALFGGREILSIVGRVHPLHLLLLAGLQTATLFLRSLSWTLLLRQEAGPVGAGTVFSSYLAGTFIESVTPSAKFGGEAARVFLLARKTGLPVARLTGVAAVSSFYSLLPFAGFLLLTGWMARSLPIVSAPVLAAAALFAAFVAGLGIFSLAGRPVREEPEAAPPANRAGRVIRLLRESSAQARQLAQSPGQRLGLIGIGTLLWGLYPLKLIWVASALGLRPGAAVLMAGVYIAYLVSMVPLLPGGLGTFEGTLSMILVSGGLSVPEALATALLLRALTYWFPLALSAGAAAREASVFLPRRRMGNGEEQSLAA